MRGNTGVVWHLKNKIGQSALHLAAAYGHDEIVKLLLGEGVGVTLKDLDGRTALHWAALRCHAQLLLRYRVDVSATDKPGRTILHTAIRFQNHTAIQLLLASRVDVTAKASDGRNALQYAIDDGNNYITALLSRHYFIHSLTLSSEVWDAAKEHI